MHVICDVDIVHIVITLNLFVFSIRYFHTLYDLGEILPLSFCTTYSAHGNYCVFSCFAIYSCLVVCHFGAWFEIMLMLVISGYHVFVDFGDLVMLMMS